MSIIILNNRPSWVLPQASIDLDFQNNRYYQSGVGSSLTSLVTVSRASSGTNLTPTSASGASYITFGSNTLRLTPSSGVLIEESRTNNLLNSAAPVTQTTASLGTGTYTLWVNGSGSATSSAGTATLTGAGAATNGTPNTFVVTVAGTVVITVTGSLNAFQCELGTFGTSFIITTGSTATKAADVLTMNSVPVFGPTFSALAKFTPEAVVGYATNQISVEISDSTLTNRGNMQRGGGGVSGAGLFGGGYVTSNSANFFVNGALASGASLLQNVSLKEATTWTSTGTTLNKISPGGREDGASFVNGYLERLAIWPNIGLPNATLAAITS